MQTSENDSAKLMEGGEQPEGKVTGLNGCEKEDKCCLCMPIKCGILVLCVMQLFTLFVFVPIYDYGVWTQ